MLGLIWALFRANPAYRDWASEGFVEFQRVRVRFRMRLSEFGLHFLAVQWPENSLRGLQIQKQCSA